MKRFANGDNSVLKQHYEKKVLELEHEKKVLQVSIGTGSRSEVVCNSCLSSHLILILSTERDRGAEEQAW